MSKIFDNINGMIAHATFDRDNVRMLTLRALKAELLKAKTEKNAKSLDDARELQIIQKMVKQRQESAKLYEDADRLELAANEKAEISILLEFLPEEVSNEQLEAEVLNCGIELIKANMGSIMKVVKTKYPTADGKVLSEIVKSHLS